ncbi:MAG: zf-HC2 domain-containing protein [Anaerolineae bacterium]|nr:zf-HC2 domain-containing protein [Anaerolineae bacterium]
MNEYRMPTCEEMVEFVTDYLEGRLPEADRLGFEAHLRLCVGCQHYLDQMRRTVTATGALAGETLDAISRDALLKVYRAWLEERDSP